MFGGKGCIVDGNVLGRHTVWGNILAEMPSEIQRQNCQGKAWGGKMSGEICPERCPGGLSRRELSREVITGMGTVYGGSSGKMPGECRWDYMSLHAVTICDNLIKTQTAFDHLYY